MDFGERYAFVTGDGEYSGVRKIADTVKRDLYMVTGNSGEDYSPEEFRGNLIIYGTIGKSEIVESLAEEKGLDLSRIRNKREVYGFFVIKEPMRNVKEAVVIVGSDKRGTIYGLFRLSELIGVSPLINWNHVIPKRKHAEVTEKDNFISKEPSVRYRGFFINDEWPAFGNWATEHFGGINAACYERVFELLLRLKGNYLWPAMWRSNFNLDGPGLESARLADEYGIVMSTSHHEPCMRAGEEFNLFKGEASGYGNAWNFMTNREGITNFWRDGLIRNREFENVITMGMRGERDSAILGRDAGLKANIDLLRDVLRTQNRLIKENVNEDLTKVPRQIVLFTEVEEFFYGDDTTEGLMGDPELDGVTLMLSDNNFGYTRTLPGENMRTHRGGYGMYYHMDMHGGAYSYQWIGSTYLPRVWEQMTQAYEYGVREIWVTNIGDIGTQEYGLSFFLDLAYDIEKWGGKDSRITEEYTAQWVRRHFADGFEADRLETIEKMLFDYTLLLERRKHEIMNADVYHPLHFGEAEEVLRISERLLSEAEKLKNECRPENMAAYVSLIYYPVCGTANLMKMWILAGRNRLFAQQNRIETNDLVPEIRACLARDAALIEEYETVDSGFFKGFGKSPHIGFTNWNDEDCKYPVLHEIIPADEPRMLLSRAGDEHYMTGTIWCNRPQTWDDFLRPDVNEIEFDLSNGSNREYMFDIETDSRLLSFSQAEGTVKKRTRVTVLLNRSDILGEERAAFTVRAYADREKTGCFAEAVVTLNISDRQYDEYPKGTFVENEGYVSMKAEHFAAEYRTPDAGFELLKPYGREGSAMKVFPTSADFVFAEDRPYLEYLFAVRETGRYRICFYLAPTTPVCFERRQYMGFTLNNDSMRIINTVKDEANPFFLSRQWSEEAMNSVKMLECEAECETGLNRLRFFGMSPGIIPEKIVLWPANKELPHSYLGPAESYRV